MRGVDLSITFGEGVVRASWSALSPYRHRYSCNDMTTRNESLPFRRLTISAEPLLRRTSGT